MMADESCHACLIHSRLPTRFSVICLRKLDVLLDDLEGMCGQCHDRRVGFESPYYYFFGGGRGLGGEEVLITDCVGNSRPCRVSACMTQCLLQVQAPSQGELVQQVADLLSVWYLGERLRGKSHFFREKEKEFTLVGMVSM